MAFKFNPITGQLDLVNESSTASSSFKTISTPSGSSPVATSPTDTLTLTSSDGSLSITGNSGTDTINITNTGVIDSTMMVVWNDDFDASSPGGTTNFGTANTSISAPLDTGSIGVTKISTTTGTTSVGYIYKDVHYSFGGASYSLEFRCQLNVLSNGTDTYILRLGFDDRLDLTAVSNGIWFEYTDGVNSGKYTINAANGGVKTTTNTNITAVNGSWVKFKIVVAADGSSANFYIDGVLVGNISTNMPTGAAQKTALIFLIAKSAGTTARFFYMDYCNLHAVFTTPR